MARFPDILGDKDNWAPILRDFEFVSHNPDGTIKGSALAAAGADPAAIDRLETRKYDIRDVGGPISATDNGPVFQAAIDAIEALGGGELTGPLQEYPFLTGFRAKHKVTFNFPEGTHFNFSGMTTAATYTGTTTTLSAGSAIAGTGSTTALPALSTAGAKWSRTLTFVSAPGLVIGDLIDIYNPADFSFSPYRPTYRNGQKATVVAVSGNTVTLDIPLYATFPTTSELYKITPIYTNFTGIRMTFAHDAGGINIELGANVGFRNLDLTGSGRNHIWVSRCYKVSFDRVWAAYYGARVGVDYGIIVGASQHVTVDRCFLDTHRHGFTTGGGNGINSTPNRDIQITNSYINGRDSLNVLSGGLNFHGNTEYWRVSGCTIPGGFNPSGDHGSIENSDIWTTGGGYAIFSSEVLGSSLTLDRVRIHVTNNHGNEGGFVYLRHRLEASASITEQVGSGLLRGGTIKVRNCTVNMNGFVGGTNGTFGIMAELFTDFDAPNTASIEIEGLEITGAPAVTGARCYAAQVYGQTGKAWQHVRIRRPIGELGYYIRSGGSESIEVSDLSLRNARWSGLEIVWPATQIYNSGQVTIRNVDIRHSHLFNIEINANNDATNGTTVLLDNVTVLNGNENSFTGSNGAGLKLYTIKRLIRRNTIYGDERAVPKQLYADALSGVTEMIDDNPRILGTVRNRLGTPTTLRFNGPVQGAPTFAAAVGSQARREDGGAITTLYINETGTTTWRAV